MGSTNSERAVEAFDSLPADSEGEKDYEVGPARVETVNNFASYQRPDFAEVRLYIEIPGQREIEIADRVPMDQFDMGQLEELIRVVTKMGLLRFSDVAQR